MIQRTNYQNRNTVIKVKLGKTLEVTGISKFFLSTATTMETSMEISQKLKPEVPFNPANHLLSSYLCFTVKIKFINIEKFYYLVEQEANWFNQNSYKRTCTLFFKASYLSDICTPMFIVA